MTALSRCSARSGADQDLEGRGGPVVVDRVDQVDRVVVARERLQETSIGGNGSRANCAIAGSHFRAFIFTPHKTYHFGPGGADAFRLFRHTTGSQRS